MVWYTHYPLPNRLCANSKSSNALPRLYEVSPKLQALCLVDGEPNILLDIDILRELRRVLPVVNVPDHASCLAGVAGLVNQEVDFKGAIVIVDIFSRCRVVRPLLAWPREPTDMDTDMTGAEMNDSLEFLVNACSALEQERLARDSCS